MIMTLLVLLSFSHLLLLLAIEANNSSSVLELRLGLNLSPSMGDPMNNHPFSMSSLEAIPGFKGAYFVPMLSSPSFNSSNSSDQIPGFSLGFLFIPAATPAFGIYLAVCGGISGNRSEFTYGTTLQGVKDSLQQEYYGTFPITVDGYAVPVWIANPSSPLASRNSSLAVVELKHMQGGSNTTKQLQLKDYDGTVLWSVSNVELMEMEDTGNLTIYDSNHAVVWQSGPRDTLFVGENLTVGKQLTSVDSSYTARMEKGGLVLYANTIQFTVETPAPYWAIPAVLSPEDNPFNVSNKVMSSPCRLSDSTAYATLKADEYLFAFQLKTGHNCMNSDSNLIMISDQAGFGSYVAGPLSFVKLEKDGLLHMYAVNPSDVANPSPLPFLDVLSNEDVINKPILQVSLWNNCFVPLSCGTLGVCTPYASSSCMCPAPSFQPKDNNNLFKGCDRTKALPRCTKDEHVNTTQFLQLNQTASVLLFSGLLGLFNSSSVKDVETCKTSCSSKCSCNGFFYVQANTSACFFITDEMSLLNLTSDIMRGHTLKYMPGIAVNISWPVNIHKKDYVTYLKVTADPPAARRTAGLARNAVIAIAVVSSFAALVGFGLAMLLLHTRETKRRKQARQAAMEEELREVLPLLPSRFSYQDLHEATNGFSKLLGAGGCGSVYSGVLQDGRRVAVKTLDLIIKGQLSKQFLAEVATIGQTSHHNIVRLVGFCWEVSNRLLVYEYMERGSLDQWLFPKPGIDIYDDEGAAPLLDWKTRYNVVLGIVRGLNYLHEDCPQPILHFDIKPQNILLDGAFVAKLADFGMSRLMQRDVSHVVTVVRGTPGYIAPEWFTHGAVSKKSDIYSMGMVMLELVGGRKNLDLELLNNVHNPADESTSGSVLQQEEWHFPTWAARRCEEGLEMELVDKRLGGAFNEEQARRLIYTAFWCIQEDAGMRPYGPTVLKWLEGSSPVKQPPFWSTAHTSSSRSRPSAASTSPVFSSLGISSSLL